MVGARPVGNPGLPRFDLVAHTGGLRERRRWRTFRYSGRGRIRTHSSLSTTMAPVLRSSVTWSRLARMMADCSAARRPARRRMSRTDGLRSLGPGTRGRQSRCQLRPGPGFPQRRERGPLRRWPPASRDRGDGSHRGLVRSSFRPAAATGCCRSGTSRGMPERQLPLPDGFSGVEQRLVEILASEVRVLGQDLLVVMPSATIATTVATGKRSPRMQGRPPMTSGSVVMRSKVTLR